MDARHIVLNSLDAQVYSLPTEVLPLSEAHGRVIASPITADRDYPPLDRSVRDGFAVRMADLPGPLKVRGEVRAGGFASESIQAGEAIEIMTGAPLPQNADTVVMVEHVDRLPNGFIRANRPSQWGEFINRRGAEARQDVALIHSGVKLDAAHIATLAMTGHSQLAVFTKPRVAILATGDEIVPLHATPAPHEIRNSNSHMLAALVAACGGAPDILPVARDQAEDLAALLQQGLTYDMLITTGGVSAGKYDLVKPVLRSLGVDFKFERVKIQPGQPTAFGLYGAKPVFGLPGNPASTLVTFQLFARPALEVLMGMKSPLLPLLTARFSAPFTHKPGLTRFLPAHLASDGESLQHIPWHGSSDIPALARSNAFLVAAHDRESWAPGDSVRVLLKV